MDRAIFSFINGFAGRWPLLDWLGIFFASYLPYLIVGGAIVMALFPIARVRHWRKTGRVALFAMLGSYAVFKGGLPFLVPRARPFAVLNEVTRLIEANPLELYRSFPSGHAVLSFALAFVIYLYDKKVGRWFLAAAVLIGVARVFVGVHWPSDVLVGAVLGMVGAVVARKKVAWFPRFWNRILPTS